MKVSRALAAVFLLLTPTLFFLVVGALAPSPECTRTGGWLGICCACCAWCVKKRKKLKLRVRGACWQILTILRSITQPFGIRISNI